MRPGQIRRAIDEKWPVVLPIGVLEYHAAHLGVGVDTLVVVKSIEKLAEQMDLVILPPFYYGAGSYVVAGPERNGTVHVDAEAILPFAKQLLASLLRIGFRNIHGVVHHQSENFSAGMPTDLAFKLAARQAIFAHLNDERGEGWWGSESMADYYDQHEAGENPFNWIQFHPLMDEQTQKAYTFDHAGIGETSLMMALCPEGVDMTQRDDEHWYARTAGQASAEYGQTAVKRILEHLKEVLTQP
jgi:creatinine amidohydrolase